MSGGLRALAVIAAAGCGAPRGAPGPRCPAGGTVVLAAQEDVAAFAGCTRAAGILIRTGAPVDVGPLHALREITGDLVIGPTLAVDEVSLDGLVRVDGVIRVVSNGSLHGVFLPRLEAAGGLEIDGNHALTAVAAPRLASVKGAVTVTDNEALGLFDASALESIGGALTIVGEAKLSLLELGRLGRAGDVRIERDPALPAGVAERLRGAGTGTSTSTRTGTGAAAGR